MAAPKEQLACSSTYNIADFRQKAAPACVTDSANSPLARNERQQHGTDTSSIERDPLIS